MDGTPVFSVNDYRRLKEERARKAALEQAVPVELPSGVTFLLYRPPIQSYVMQGRVPDGLLRMGMDAWKLQGVVSDENNIAQLTPKEVTESLIFMRELVREACVMPRLTINPQSEEELDPAELSVEDFNFILAYAMGKEGGEAEALGKFRQGRAEAATQPRANGSRIRQKAERVTGDQ